MFDINFENNEILKKVKSFRSQFNLDDKLITIDMLENLNDDLIVLKFPNNLKVSGACMEKKDIDKVYKCIYINTNEIVGRNIFTFCHELYHIYYEKSQIGLCVEDLRYKDPIERRAEMFASNLLIPRYKLLLDLKNMGLNSDKEVKRQNIFELQIKYNVSFQAIVYVLEDIKKINKYKEFSNYVPQIPQGIKMYYTKSKWNELSNLSEDYGLVLNSIKPRYEIPENFKQNLIENYKNKKTDYIEIKDIFDFFEIEDELKRIEV